MKPLLSLNTNAPSNTLNAVEHSRLSSRDVELSILHPGNVRQAEDLAEHSERPCLIRREGHIIAFAGTQYDTFWEVVGYCKPVVLSWVIVHEVDSNTLTSCDIHYRLRKAVDLTIVVSVSRHYHCEVGRVWCVSRTTCTTRCPEPKQMKCVRGNNESCASNNDDHYC